MKKYRNTRIVQTLIKQEIARTTEALSIIHILVVLFWRGLWCEIAVEVLLRLEIVNRWNCNFDKK